MRDYSTVAPSFWTGKTGKSLRGDLTAQVVALYLMTSPHANMYGVYHLPVLYIAHETGCPLEGASEALRRLSERGFCTYDHTTETVFVHEMAKFQVGEDLSPLDNRIKGVVKALAKMPKGVIREGFRKRYKVSYYLPDPTEEDEPLPSPLEAPSKPLRSQEQEQEQEQDSKNGESGSAALRLAARSKIAADTPADPPPPAPTPKAKRPLPHRIPDDWSPGEKDLSFATERGLDVIRTMELADQFRDHYQGASGKGSTSPDWSAKWRTWVQNEIRWAAERAERRPASNGHARQNGQGGYFEAYQSVANSLPRR